MSRPSPSHSRPKTRGTDCGHRDFLPICSAVKLCAIIMIAIVTAGIRTECTGCRSHDRLWSGVAFTHCSPDPGLRICHVFHYGSHIPMPPAFLGCSRANARVCSGTDYYSKGSFEISINTYKFVKLIKKNISLLSLKNLLLRSTHPPTASHKY